MALAPGFADPNSIRARTITALNGGRYLLGALGLLGLFWPHVAEAQWSLGLGPHLDFGTKAAGTRSSTDLFEVGALSGDARAVRRNDGAAARPIVGIGYELSLNVQLHDRVEVTTDVFVTDVDRSIVWVGDEDADLPTRKMGFEAAAAMALLPWLHADVHFATTTEQFNDPQPGTDLWPSLTLGGGIMIVSSGLSGQLAVEHVTDQPESDVDLVATLRSTEVGFTIGYEVATFELHVTVAHTLESASEGASSIDTESSARLDTSFSF